jgi:hypothetical protein
LLTLPAIAGPPFQTDDPGVTPYHFLDVSTVFGQTADEIGERGSIGISSGTMRQMAGQRTLLFSLGRSVSSLPSFSGFAAYELLVGPRANANAH